MEPRLEVLAHVAACGAAPWNSSLMDLRVAEHRITSGGEAQLDVVCLLLVACGPKRAA